MITSLLSASPARRGLALVVLAAVLWGTLGIAIKGLLAVAETNALSLGFLRLALSVPFLLLTSRLALGRAVPPLKREVLPPLALFGVMMALYQVAYVLAIRRVGVAIAVLVAICTAPVIVALLSALLQRERLTRRTLAALALALAGTALLVGVPTGSAAAPQQTLEGVGLACAAALCYALVVLAGRALAPHCHPLHAAGLGFAIGALALLPAALGGGLVLAYPLAGWGLLLYIGVVPTALGYVLFLRGLRTTGATAAAIATMLEPLTSTLLAVVIYGEQLGLWGVLGAAFLLAVILLL